MVSSVAIAEPLPARTAQLALYGGGDVDAASAALFARVRSRLVASGVRHVPDRLPFHAVDLHDPDLLLAQVCGLPLLVRHHEVLSIIATPHYDVPGAEGPHHRSFLVMAEKAPYDLARLRKGDLTLAVNSEDSNTGRSLLADVLLRALGTLDLRGRILITGSHDASMACVERGEADLAAIDCVTFNHLVRHDPARRAAVKILAASRPVPAPPFVTGRNTTRHDREVLRRALVDAITDYALAPKIEPLRIRGFSELAESAYYPMLHLHEQAERAFSSFERVAR